MNPCLVLNDRTLWFDGSITVSSKDIENFIQFLNSGKLYVDELTNELIQFNKFSGLNKILIKSSLENIDSKWVIPKKFLDIELESYITNTLIDYAIAHDISDDDLKIRLSRIDYEYKKFEEFQMLGVLRAILFIINRFEENHIVWGVGRGSSVASYILYLLKVHDVDSVKYDLDFSEFMR